MIKNLFIIKVLIIFEINKRQIISRGDCGLPAIPDLTKLNVFKSRYDEQSVIAYECEDTNGELIEGKFRKCINHRWNGSLPRCAKEVENILLKRIEITELGRPHPLYREIGSVSRVGRIVNNNVKYFDCPKTKFLWTINNSQNWTFKIIRDYYIKYFVLYMKGDSLLENQNQNKLRLSASLGDIVVTRMCEIEKFLVLNDSITYKIGFICNGTEQMVKAQEGIDESIQKIVIRVEVPDNTNLTITFCDLKLYIISDSCGEPEIPLNSVLLAKRNTYSVFTCRDNYYLFGEQKVECRMNGTWAKPFPLCRPNKTCPIPAVESEDPFLHIQYKHFYIENGTKFGEPDDVAVYSCIGSINGTDMKMVGQASRVCKDGKWSGSQPVCHKITDVLVSEHTNDMSLHSDLAMNMQSKRYSSTKLFIIVMAMFGSFFIGGVSVGVIIYLIVKKRKNSVKRPNISIVVDESSDIFYDRPQEYASLRVSQISNFSNELLNPLYEDYHNYGQSLNIPLEESVENKKSLNT